MKNLILILLILLIILLPLITSLLLSWPWIQEFTIRQVIVYVLIGLEIASILLLIVQYLKGLQK